MLWQLLEVRSEIEERYGIGAVRGIVGMYGKEGNLIPSIRLKTLSSFYITMCLNKKKERIRRSSTRSTSDQWIAPLCCNCHEN